MPPLIIWNHLNCGGTTLCSEQMRPMFTLRVLFSEHLFSKSTPSRDLSHVWGPTEFWPSVRTAFESVLYTDLGKTITDACRWNRLVEKIASNREGAVLVDRCAEDWWFLLYCLTNSGRVKRKGPNNEAWSLPFHLSWKLFPPHSPTPSPATFVQQYHYLVVYWTPPLFPIGAIVGFFAASLWLCCAVYLKIIWLEMEQGALCILNCLTACGSGVFQTNWNGIILVIHMDNNNNNDNNDAFIYVPFLTQSTSPITWNKMSLQKKK